VLEGDVVLEGDGVAESALAIATPPATVAPTANAARLAAVTVAIFFMCCPLGLCVFDCVRRERELRRTQVRGW
jgi:hypothetical protein